MPLPSIVLHPLSVKHLAKGHPWVTKDSYTRHIPKKAKFFVGTDHQKKPLGLFLHDPLHSKVAGRLWSEKIVSNFQESLFLDQVKQRILTAVAKRLNPSLFASRENVYLVFGEADFLPGLFIIKLGNYLLVQLYADFWANLKQELCNILTQVRKELDIFSSLEGLWIQERGRQKPKFFYALSNSKNNHSEFIISEFNSLYNIKMKDHYDIGLYTDMAGIRKQLIPYMKPGHTLLNLYSYTGSFTLLGFAQKLQHITSVDLSKKYMTWLEGNIDINSYARDQHTAIVAPVEKALDNLISQNEKFNLIICDPPSASSDGKKTQQAFQNYSNQIKKLSQLLAPNGRIVLFLNTHNISSQKFRGNIAKSLKDHDLNKTLKIEKELRLCDDCSPLPHFIEGDYLKGIVLSAAI